jgi:hypothetical protein
MGRTLNKDRQEEFGDTKGVNRGRTPSPSSVYGP